MACGRGAAVVLLALVAVAAGCTERGGGGDAGEVDAGHDAGEVDAGHDAGEVDAGHDAGVGVVTDGGTAGDAGTVVLPSLEGWQFYGPSEGGPRVVLGVSMDEGGNIWVAGDAEGLFLLEPGHAELRRFTVADGLASYVDASGVHGYDVISVAGGPAGTVFVGYRGLFGAHEDLDPPELQRSGDADRVVLNGGGLSVSHFDISTPPGQYPQYPNGREKIRSVYRIVYDRATGDVWFGGNHGVAMWSRRYQQVFEHQHAAVNGYTRQGYYTILSGDWYGLALDPSGDVWMGGGVRAARLNYASGGGGFWASLNPVLDIWPDAVQEDARADQRTDDFVQDLAVSHGGELWVGSLPNGLAVVTPGGTHFIRGGLVNPAVTSLEVDPEDGSIWVGHLYGGVTRLVGDRRIHFDYRSLGPSLIDGPVPDIQSRVWGGRRYILVAFQRGAIGVYSGR